MLNNIIGEREVHLTKNAIDDSNKIVITCHVGPDGDALGSSLGLWHFLKTLGKEATVIVPSPFPEFIGWLPGVQHILVYTQNVEVANEKIAEADLIFALDYNVPSRLEKLEDAIVAAKAKKIMVDHHLNPAENFAQVIISFPEIASTSELIFRLICRMGMFSKINIAGATAIYTGMMTDTGAFTYNSNSPEIYTIITELIKLGIDKDEIYRKVFNTSSESRLRLQGYCIYEKMKIYPEYRTALITLSKAEQERFNFQNGDAEGFVNIPLSINDVIFSAFIKEDSDKVKISLRSKGTFPTNKFSQQIFGGGGHLNASGGESYVSLEETVEKFENALEGFKDLLTE